jgi:hypothetical protein
MIEVYRFTTVFIMEVASYLSKCFIDKVVPLGLLLHWLPSELVSRFCLKGNESLFPIIISDVEINFVFRSIRATAPAFCILNLTHDLIVKFDCPRCGCMSCCRLNYNWVVFH